MAETRLETQQISVMCRANRGMEGAWDEAVARLRQVYEAQIIRNTAVTLALTISRVTAE